MQNYIQNGQVITVAAPAGGVTSGEGLIVGNIFGAKLADLNLKNAVVPHFGVKESVFPFNRFPNADIILGPEMKSTGEVMGIDRSFGIAFANTGPLAEGPIAAGVARAVEAAGFTWRSRRRHFSLMTR